MRKPVPLLIRTVDQFNKMTAAEKALAEKIITPGGIVLKSKDGEVYR